MSKIEPPPSDSPTIRLLLVDDHPVLRTGLSKVLNYEPGFKVIGEADDGRTALSLWRIHRPDVMLLDLSMAKMNGLETLEALRQEFPEAKVLVLTSSEAREDLLHCLRAGALGYVTKSVRHHELVAAIRKVNAGQQTLGDLMSQQLAGCDENGAVSRREVEVLSLLRQGFTNGEIGRLLGISEHTAKKHVAALLLKLEAADRAEAVARGFERGLLKL